MSKLIVEVCRIEAVDPHPNPKVTRMRVATVKGWKTCIRLDPDTGIAEFSPGDKCVFFPPNSVLPPALAHGQTDTPPGRLNLMRFLGQLPIDPLTKLPRPGGRVRAARLQGYPSYGFVMPIDPVWGDDQNWAIGTDVAEHFGVTKWEPPPDSSPDAAPNYIRFHPYTSIQSFGNYPHLLVPGIRVIFTEKLHGRNTRAGEVLFGDDLATAEWTFMVGSHDSRRIAVGTDGRPSVYWSSVNDNVRALITYLRQEYPWDEPKYSIIVFGETLGTEDTKYGLKPGTLGYRGFDIAINQKYLSYGVKKALFAQFGIDMVPVLYEGPFSVDVLEQYTSGPTTMCKAGDAGKFKGREGIVITPVDETFSAELCDRLILKSVSADFEERRGGTDTH